MKGFNSEAEMYSMVSQVDISTNEGRGAFNRWKTFDGTREGLASIIEAQQNAGKRLQKKRQKIEAHIAKHGAHEVVIAAYGRGVNSTAMLIEMVKRGERIDAILSADTGDEYHESYVYSDMFSDWLVAHGYPPVTVVRKGGRRETLWENCMRMKMLPSMAYGLKGCSHKFKIEPQETWCNNYVPALAAWSRGEKVTKLIGYDMDEPHRAKIPEDAKYQYRYPLLEFGWGRDECVERIEQEGLPVPRGSSCWHCPAHTKQEVLAQSRTHPWYTGMALMMEANAENLQTVKGLGRRWSWHDLIIGIEPVRGGEVKREPCGACYDGGRE